jgi:hypothetical protein
VLNERTLAALANATAGGGTALGDRRLIGRRCSSADCFVNDSGRVGLAAAANVMPTQNGVQNASKFICLCTRAG